MGVFQDKFYKENNFKPYEKLDDIIYVIACILSLGLVYLITIIIEKGVSNPLGYLGLMIKDIEVEVGKIKEEIGEIKKNTDTIKSEIEALKGRVGH